ACRPMLNTEAPHAHAIVTLSSVGHPPAMTGPERFEIDCVRRPDVNAIAALGEVAAESLEIRLRPAEGRRIARHEMSDSQGHEVNIKNEPRRHNDTKNLFFVSLCRRG